MEKGLIAEQKLKILTRSLLDTKDCLDLIADIAIKDAVKHLATQQIRIIHDTLYSVGYLTHPAAKKDNTNG